MKQLFKFALIAVLGIAIISSCERIDAGHVGLKVNYYGSDKGVSGVTEVTGTVFYNPMASTIVEFPTFTQTKDYTPFIVTARDASEFTVDPTISYFVSSDKAPHIYTQYRKPLEDLEDGILRNLVYDAYRITANKFTSDSLMSNRGKFEAQLQTQLSKDMAEAGFTFQQLTSAITPPASLKAAIDAKNKAIQESFTTKNLVEKEKAQAEIAIAKAHGIAESQLISANAEAEANRKIAASLSPELVEWKRLDRWDGKYPSTMLGSNTSALFSIK